MGTGWTLPAGSRDVSHAGAQSRPIVSVFGAWAEPFAQPACREPCCTNCWSCPGCFLQAGPTPHSAGPMGSAGLRAGSTGSQLLSLSQVALTCSQAAALWPHPFKNPLWGVHSQCVGLAWKICIAGRNMGSGDMGQGEQSQLSPASRVSHCCALYTSAERTRGCQAPRKGFPCCAPCPCQEWGPYTCP